MHKLVILISPLADASTFEDRWPEFLHLVETLPGLLKESTSRVERFLYGQLVCSQVHELYFNTLPELEAALASPPGVAAGRLLQQISAGRLTLFIADHREDDLENIRKYRLGQDAPAAEEAST